MEEPAGGEPADAAASADAPDERAADATANATDERAVGAEGDSEVPTDERITVRLVMPDRWLEHVAELPASMPVEEAKRVGLRQMLQRGTDDPDDFYVEYAERQVPDESVTLEELGVRPREILSIRAYDLGHYPRFEG